MQNQTKQTDTAAGWCPISDAPCGPDLELAVIDSDGPHALVFPCRRGSGSWINSETEQLVPVQPTHWRLWRPH